MLGMSSVSPVQAAHLLCTRESVRRDAGCGGPPKHATHRVLAFPSVEDESAGDSTRRHPLAGVHSLTASRDMASPQHVAIDVDRWDRGV